MKPLLISVLLACLTFSCKNVRELFFPTAPPPIYVQGVVANVNITQGYTWVTIISDGQITPLAYALDGVHPEFWQREFVGIQIRLQGGGVSYDLLSFRRIGADK